MAFSNVSEWSTTAADNGNFAAPGFPAEGCSPSSVNDSTREMMAQLRREICNQGSAIASASTTNIAATGTSVYAHITGTTTITSFGTANAGVRRWVVFDGILTLTHSAALVLPGLANITTAAGDDACFVSEGSGNWRCSSYSKASGGPVVSNGGEWRNVIGSNGGMEVWRRGAGGTASIAQAASTTAYTVDRWYFNTNANQACTISQQAGITSGSRFCARVQRNAGQTGTSGMVFGYPLDSDEVFRLRGKTPRLRLALRLGTNFSGTLTCALATGTGAVQKLTVGYTSRVDILTATLHTQATPGGAAVELQFPGSAAGGAFDKAR